MASSAASRPLGELGPIGGASGGANVVLQGRHGGVARSGSSISRARPPLSDTRYLQPPLTQKGPYFRKSGCENRTRPQKLSTCGDPRATSFSENRTPASKNRTLPMAGSCSRSAGLRVPPEDPVLVTIRQNYSPYQSITGKTGKISTWKREKKAQKVVPSDGTQTMHK